MASNAKRRRLSPPPSNDVSLSPTPLPFFVEAHEAVLLYRAEVLSSQVDGREGEVAGGRMIRWKGSKEDAWPDEEEEEKVDDSSEVWIDRYDILHLLSSLPSPHSTREASPPLSIGFESLPVDHEEMFYFTPDERVDINRKRKKREMEDARQERIDARKREEEEEREKERQASKPTPTQLSFMQALQTTLSSSPDPALLEIRILTNHGSDERFSFLRKGGKFRDIWEGMRSGKDLENATIDEKVVEEKIMGAGLVGYDGSDSDPDSGADIEASNEVSPSTITTTSASITLSSSSLLDIATSSTLDGPEIIEGGEEVEEAERKRLVKLEKVKEWARKRKEAREI